MNFFYYLQIEDPYLNPPKTWRFCQTKFRNHPNGIASNGFEISSSKYHTQNRFGNVDDFHRSSNQEGVLLLQSYLNILKVRQMTLGSVNDESILLFNVPIKAVEDSDVLQKVNDKIKIIKNINLKNNAINVNTPQLIHPLILRFNRSQSIVTYTLLRTLVTLEYRMGQLIPQFLPPIMKSPQTPEDVILICVYSEEFVTLHHKNANAGDRILVSSFSDDMHTL